MNGANIAHHCVEHSTWDARVCYKKIDGKKYKWLKNFPVREFEKKN